MSSQDPTDSTDLVSKVSFFPVSDSTGENKALIVTIKKVIPEGDEKLKVMEASNNRSSPETSKSRLLEIPGSSSSSSRSPRRSLSLETQKSSSSRNTKKEVDEKAKEIRRKTKSSRSSSEKSSKSASSQTQSGVSHETQTSVEIPVPGITNEGHSHSSPCIKHAAQNFSAKASSLTSEKTPLCNNCSKSVLSYIFLVQDFLDSVTKEIVGDTNTKNCMQCLREESRLDFINEMSSALGSELKRSSKVRERIKASHPKETQRDTRKYKETAEQLVQRSISQHQQDDLERSVSQHYGDGSVRHQYQHPASGHELSQSYEATPPRPYQEDVPFRKPAERQQPNFMESFSDQQNDGDNSAHQQAGCDIFTDPSQYEGDSSSHEVGRDISHEHKNGSSSHDGFVHQGDDSLHQYKDNDSGHQYRGDEDSGHQYKGDEGSGHQYKGNEGSGHGEAVSSPISEGVDGIVSVLSSIERGVYDSARNAAGWDSLSSEHQERLESPSSHNTPSQAFVTMCRNNAEVLGCLVLGTSLLLRTSRTLCVLVSDGVSNAFRGPLSSVFHVVQLVRSMDSLGTTKLSLLEQPELGISFEKLNVWRLVQFNKCVYLNPDTLVIQNCDELFSQAELSAVPDIGWPDCFNSGVFVFVPSVKTFWQLLEFAEKRGSYDGGDQGLLNSYFDSWSGDIGRKLSFIYNLMANVSYTYTPAFKQFGRDVKIVQFHGSFKPWHVIFYSRTGQIAPASAVHPTYVQFVHIWINIFRISCLRQLSQEIQTYAQQHETICAVEFLRFFPLSTESEADFFLTPPSVRIRLAERKFRRSLQETPPGRRKSAESLNTSRDEGDTAVPPFVDDLKTPVRTTCSSEKSGKGEASSAEVIDEEKKPESALPGSEIGDYQGMKAWEQGRMDYQGTDSSETIIRRLQFLMQQPK